MLCSTLFFSFCVSFVLQSLARDKSRRDPCTGKTGAGLDKVLAALQAELDGIATTTRVQMAAVKEDVPASVCDAACRQAIEGEVNKAFAGKTEKEEITKADWNIRTFYNYYNSHKLGRVQKFRVNSHKLQYHILKAAAAAATNMASEAASRMKRATKVGNNIMLPLPPSLPPLPLPPLELSLRQPVVFQAI